MRLHPWAPQGCAAACVRPCVHTEGTHPPRAAAPLGSSSCPPASCQQARHSRTGLSGCFFPPWRGLGREMWPRCNANRQGLCTTSSWGWEPARARGTPTGPGQSLCWLQVMLRQPPGGFWGPPRCCPPCRGVCLPGQGLPRAPLQPGAASCPCNKPRRRSHLLLALRPGLPGEMTTPAGSRGH